MADKLPPLPKGLTIVDDKLPPLPKGLTVVEEKKNRIQNAPPTGTQTSKSGSLPFQSQVDTETPSVLLSDAQKQQREQERIGKRFETTLLNIPTEFGRVAPAMKAAKQIQETLPEAPSFRKYGEIPRMQPTAMTEGQLLGESLTKGTDFQELTTDKFTEKKTGLQKQIENAENAFRAYQGDELANQVQSYIPPEETLKIKQELGFGEKMSNAGSNFVNKLERFVPNTALAVGQTLTTLLGEDLGSDAYRMVTAGGNADIHRMEAFDKLAKLDAEYKYSKGLIQSVQDLDLGGVAAAVTDAVGSIVSSVVTSAPTAGLGLYSDMVGGGLYDYNSTKANRLGISTNELYESGQNEFFVPAIINGIGAKLESIGLKGIKEGIISNITSKAGQKAGLIFHNSNKEGFTEWTQSGLESYSNSLAQGKNFIQAGEDAVKTMFSKKGAESYLMGSVAAGAAIGGGRILKGIFSSKERKKAAEAIQRIEQQQQELSNPDISEESRVFIFDNIKNNIKEVVDAVYADVDESDNLSGNQKKEVSELNKTVQALEVVINDPAVSEETKASAQTKIDELKSKIDGIIAAPEVKIAKPTFDTEEQLIEEGKTAEEEYKKTGDQVTYEQKIKELEEREKNLVPVPKDAEIGKPEEVIADVEVKKVDIEKRRQEELNKTSVDSRIKPGAGTGVKVGQEVNDGNKVIVLNSTENDSYNPEINGDGYAVYSKIVTDAEFIDGKMSKAAEVEVEIFSDKETADRVLEERYKKYKTKELSGEGKKIQAINAKYDAELAALEITKPQEDAVQVETAGQVPVLTEATVGEEVEQGKPQAEPQVVAQEGVQEEVTKPQQLKAEKPIVSEEAVSENIEQTPAQQVEQLRAEEQAIKAIDYKGKKISDVKIGDVYYDYYAGAIRKFERLPNREKENGEEVYFSKVVDENIFSEGSPDDVIGFNESDYLKSRPAKTFLENAENLFYKNPFSDVLEVFGNDGKQVGWVALNKVDSDTVDVDGVVSITGGKRKGGGSQIMKMVTKNADRTGVTLTLVPEPLPRREAKGFETPEKLQAFYEKFGFVKDKGKPTMTRKPQPVLPQTIEEQIAELRIREEVELRKAIEYNEKYQTDFKIDRAKITDAKDLKKFDEIYDKYDKLITPLLEKEGSEVGGDVNFTEVEDKKIKDIATEANIKIGSYVKSIPTDKKNKFGNSINEYEATNPFTNEKITFKKQGDATDYVIKEIAKATTKSGREEIFKAVEQSLKETKAEPTPAKPKAEPKLKSKVATRFLFKKAVDLFYDISGTEGSAKKSRLAGDRRRFMEQNPSIKYIDDNWDSISKQLEAKGLLTKSKGCP